MKLPLYASPLSRLVRLCLLAILVTGWLVEAMLQEFPIIEVELDGHVVPTRILDEIKILKELNPDEQNKLVNAPMVRQVNILLVRMMTYGVGH